MVEEKAVLVEGFKGWNAGFRQVLPKWLVSSLLRDQGLQHGAHHVELEGGEEEGEGGGRGGRRKGREEGEGGGKGRRREGGGREGRGEGRGEGGGERRGGEGREEWEGGGGEGRVRGLHQRGILEDREWQQQY